MKAATRPVISASGISTTRGVEGPVPESARGGYEYWLASNVLEFTSDAYSTVLYNSDNQPVRLPGYRVDAVTDSMIRYIDAHQGDPFYLFTSYIEAAPSESS